MSNVPVKETKTKKWRGIHTTQKRKNEKKPKTVINRKGQKTISLPRIDDRKRWSGFAGLSGIARKTAKLIPECKVYVEPFSGTCKVYQELIKIPNKIEKFVLNEKADFVFGWLKREFPNAEITQEDFVDCIKRWDSPDTVFLIDGPWYESYYNQSFAVFDRPSVKAYDEEIISLMKNIKGKFIITSRRENRVFLQSKFNHKLVTSEYVVSGKYPKVMLTYNFDLRKKKNE